MSELRDELVAAAGAWVADVMVDFWAYGDLVDALMPVVREALADAAADAQREVAHQFAGAGRACGLRTGFIDGLPATCGLTADHPVHTWPAQPCRHGGVLLDVTRVGDQRRRMQCPACDTVLDGGPRD